MKLISTLLAFLLITLASFAQNCDNWLKINNAFDAVTLGDLDITGNQMTIEANFNATGDITRTLVSKHFYEIDVNYHLLPDLAQITTTNGFFYVLAPCEFIKNKTYHVAMVYDGTSLKLYRNGFLMGSTAATGNLITNNWPTAVGENSYAAFTKIINNSHPLKGFINEVRLWNVARTKEDINIYKNQSLPNPNTQSGLLGYYTFDNLANKQGNSIFNGIIQGSATINNVNPSCNYIADSCPTVLPVKISMFEIAVQNNKEIKLIWHTTDEFNISYYSIERAVNDYNGYSVIGKMNMLLNSRNNTYTYIDKNVQPGNTYNYRIVIVESTGEKRYSPIKNATILGNSMELNIFPNPTYTGLINYKVNGFKGIAQITVLNHLGEKILSNSINVSYSQTLQLDLRKHPKGIYWILIDTYDQRITKKAIRF